MIVLAAATGLTFTGPIFAIACLAITWAVLSTCGCSSTQEHRTDLDSPLVGPGDAAESAAARHLFDQELAG